MSMSRSGEWLDALRDSLSEVRGLRDGMGQRTRIIPHPHRASPSECPGARRFAYRGSFFPDRPMTTPRSGNSGVRDRHPTRGRLRTLTRVELWCEQETGREGIVVARVMRLSRSTHDPGKYYGSML